MDYKIAFASSDGEMIDRSFGAANRFYIYEVEDGRTSFSEVREFNAELPEKDTETGASCGEKTGCAGNGGGCGGGECGANPKVEALSDVRCIVAEKIGFNIRRQLERKMIAVFDVKVPLAEALDKISTYFDKVDRHISLRNS
ncbi:MAG: hypothetical protein IJM14_07440 [Lachnospiraceae bacterium]|nr:hypothetical protein [Lachnospiraceae bacterium]